jgi:hypothetical protein
VHKNEKAEGNNYKVVKVADEDDGKLKNDGLKKNEKTEDEKVGVRLIRTHDGRNRVRWREKETGRRIY